MNLLVLRSLWGLGGTIEQQLEYVGSAGYDGIEWGIGIRPNHEFKKLLRDAGLKFIAHLPVTEASEFEKSLAQVAELEPLLAVAYSGRDSMTHDEGCRFFEAAMRAEEKIGLPVAHETHRGRLLFSPWDCLYYLEQFDRLKLNADFSHWVNVCERLPEDQGQALGLACRRALHIHGRVGYEQGPQVPDPAAPEYRTQREWHENQWAQIHEHWRASGRATGTFTPEYGPPPYLHTLPYTQMPLAELDRVCLWSAARFREQWRAREQVASQASR